MFEIPNINTKSQYTKIQVGGGGAADPTINHSYKLMTGIFKMLLKFRIDPSITYQPKLTVILLDDKSSRGPIVHHQRHVPSWGK